MRLLVEENKMESFIKFCNYVICFFIGNFHFFFTQLKTDEVNDEFFESNLKLLKSNYDGLPCYEIYGVYHSKTSALPKALYDVYQVCSKDTLLKAYKDDEVKIDFDKDAYYLEINENTYHYLTVSFDFLNDLFTKNIDGITEIVTEYGNDFVKDKSQSFKLHLNNLYKYLDNNKLSTGLNKLLEIKPIIEGGKKNG